MYFQKIKDVQKMNECNRCHRSCTIFGHAIDITPAQPQWLSPPSPAKVALSPLPAGHKNDTMHRSHHVPAAETCRAAAAAFRQQPFQQALSRQKGRSHIAFQADMRCTEDFLDAASHLLLYAAGPRRARRAARRAKEHEAAATPTLSWRRAAALMFEIDMSEIAPSIT